MTVCLIGIGCLGWLWAVECLSSLVLVVGLDGDRARFGGDETAQGDLVAEELAHLD